MKPARAWTGLDRWPSLVLGRAMHDCPVEDLFPVRRRLSGGGAVMRGPWLLRAAVRLPATHGLLRYGPAHAARWFGGIHVHWLQRMGIASAQAYEGPLVEHWCCFAGRATGEAMVGRRKLSGIAQVWRRHEVLLCSGTLLAPAPWAAMCEAMNRDPCEARGIGRQVIDAQECLGAVPARLWADSLRDTLSHAVAAALRD